MNVVLIRSRIGVAIIAAALIVFPVVATSPAQAAVTVGQSIWEDNRCLSWWDRQEVKGGFDKYRVAAWCDRLEPGVTARGVLDIPDMADDTTASFTVLNQVVYSDWKTQIREPRDARITINISQRSTPLSAGATCSHNNLGDTYKTIEGDDGQTRCWRAQADGVLELRTVFGMGDNESTVEVERSGGGVDKVKLERREPGGTVNPSSFVNVATGDVIVVTDHWVGGGSVEAIEIVSYVPHVVVSPTPTPPHTVCPRVNPACLAAPSS